MSNPPKPPIKTHEVVSGRFRGRIFPNRYLAQVEFKGYRLFVDKGVLRLDEIRAFQEFLAKAAEILQSMPEPPIQAVEIRVEHEIAKVLVDTASALPAIDDDEIPF